MSRRRSYRTNQLLELANKQNDENNVVTTYSEKEILDMPVVYYNDPVNNPSKIIPNSTSNNVSIDLFVPSTSSSLPQNTLYDNVFDDTNTCDSLLLQGDILNYNIEDAVPGKIFTYNDQDSIPGMSDHSATLASTFHAETPGHIDITNPNNIDIPCPNNIETTGPNNRSLSPPLVLRSIENTIDDDMPYEKSLSDSLETRAHNNNSNHKELLIGMSESVSNEGNPNKLKIVPYSESSSEEGEQVNKIVKRRKRSQVDKSKWESQMNQSQRERGEQYLGRQKVNGEWKLIKKNKRTLKPRCKCKGTQGGVLKCNYIGEDDRNKIFQNFWKFSWGEKKVYIKNTVKQVHVKRPRDRKEMTTSKRNCSLEYYLNVEDEYIKVCRTMFTNTLNIGKDTVWSWKTQTKEGGNVTQRKNRFEKEVKCLEEFLQSLPKMESHYCRKSTSKKYLEPHFDTKKSLYKLYCEDWCKTRNVEHVSVAKFNNTLDIVNIALYKPKKDACEKCLCHKLGNISDTDYNIHIHKKESSRKEKNMDKERKNPLEFVFCMDTQAVMLAPKSNVSSLYYKTKLIVHNFCIYNLKNKKASCFLWNETEGGTTADEYATMISKFILEKVMTDENTNQDVKIILYSDGCAAQNRNATLSCALLNLAILKNITIEQKYLEVGHTQMEVDSMHATIEKKIKHKVIHVPAEYVGVCKSARKFPEPYDVLYLTHAYFKSFNNLQFHKSIRPGKVKGDPKVTDICALQYTKEGNMFYKLNYTDEWTLLPQRRNKNITATPIVELPDLYNGRRKITRRKFEDLQELKMTIPADFRDYYDNIPYETSSTT